ncbi:MAG: class I SAM-dependent methyltransferase [Clostridia bacterium]|nr:class I SAM-dependent methyltransferase [Clostridia bacterium]
MQHYFIETSHKEEDFFNFEAQILNHKLILRSCDNIFSKDELDFGSATLIETVAEIVKPKGYGLDFGCGYGVIGIALMKALDVTIDFADINQTALDLTKINLEQNKVLKKVEIIKSDNFINIEKTYDFIVTNPPIKTGKKLLFSIMQNAFNHLKNGGSLTLVIRKDHGEESLRKHLINVFGNCEILKRNKGFYILHSIKN